MGLEFSKADDKTYFVKLRENVKWHNGTEFSGQDVKFTIETIKKLGNNSIYMSNVSNIENIEIISDNLIKVYLYNPMPFFEYNLTFPIINASVFGESDITISDKNNVPIGTGKYKLESVDISSQMELKTNQNWWNIENVDLRIDTITVRIYETVAEVYNAYKLGGLDLITSQNINIENNIGTIGSNVQTNLGRNFDYLAMNCEGEILSNKEVRQAISYAINKEEIVNTIYNGKYSVADHPLEYGSYLYNENNEKYSYNANQAKKILEERWLGIKLWRMAKKSRVSYNET